MTRTVCAACTLLLLLLLLLSFGENSNVSHGMHRTLQRKKPAPQKPPPQQDAVTPQERAGGNGNDIRGAVASEKIHGGVAANPQKYRYFARLTYLVEGKLSPSCGGGVLISDRFVLTTAVCVLDIDDRGHGPGGLRSNLYGAEVGHVCDGIENCGLPFVSFKATNVWVHPDWDRFEMDLAVMRLAAPVPTALVQLGGPVPSAVAVPAAPDTGNYSMSLSRGYANNLTTVGYGLVNNSRTHPTSLQELALAFMPRDECETHWGRLDDSHMCVFTEDDERGIFGRGFCGGDSGSPAVLPRIDGPDIVVGLVSFGLPPCTQKTRPDVLARVSAGITYIANVVCYPGMSDYAPEWCLEMGWSSGSQSIGKPVSSLPDLPEPTLVVEEEEDDEAQDANDPTCEFGDKPAYHPNVSKRTKTKKCRKLRQMSPSKVRKVCLRSTSDAMTMCCYTCEVVTRR